MFIDWHHSHLKTQWQVINSDHSRESVIFWTNSKLTFLCETPFSTNLISRYYLRLPSSSLERGLSTEKIPMLIWNKVFLTLFSIPKVQVLPSSYECRPPPLVLSPLPKRSHEIQLQKHHCGHEIVLLDPHYLHRTVIIFCSLPSTYRKIVASEKALHHGTESKHTKYANKKIPTVGVAAAVDYMTLYIKI